MIKKLIKYVDPISGKSCKLEAYFHLNKLEIIELIGREGDMESEIKKFIDKLFEQHQKILIDHLNQEFSHLYLPRTQCSEIYNIFHDLERMKYEKFDRVNFQDFILGNP